MRQAMRAVLALAVTAAVNERGGVVNADICNLSGHLPALCPEENRSEIAISLIVIRKKHRDPIAVLFL